MSKQLSLSAVFSVLVMAAFALCAAPQYGTANEKGAMAATTAPAFEASLPSR